jgi:hypothetical protein
MVCLIETQNKVTRLNRVTTTKPTLLLRHTGSCLQCSAQQQSVKMPSTRLSACTHILAIPITQLIL